MAKSNASPPTSLSIQKQIKEYLERGGQITKIEKGITGLTYHKYSKQTILDRNNTKL
ncbi:hypothetical protein TDB9533_00769 [Thalassocella blandensis]|nr:hypothetical protein TDB9533_00769 [Thalassocella blandensis]